MKLATLQKRIKNFVYLKSLYRITDITTYLWAPKREIIMNFNASLLWMTENKREKQI